MLLLLPKIPLCSNIDFVFHLTLLHSLLMSYPYLRSSPTLTFQLISTHTPKSDSNNNHTTFLPCFSSSHNNPASPHFAFLFKQCTYFCKHLQLPSHQPTKQQNKTQEEIQCFPINQLTFVIDKLCSKHSSSEDSSMKSLQSSNH
jgi:hypothetical protein